MAVSCTKIAASGANASSACLSEPCKALRNQALLPRGETERTTVIDRHNRPIILGSPLANRFTRVYGELVPF
ncbi:hypothetical protein D3C80_2162000 [compost metagenome]